MGVVVQAIGEPEVPLKAMAGMRRFAASVAAPTVPEMRVVGPRFASASFRRCGMQCHLEMRKG